MDQKRTQFTFYESFAVALRRIRKVSERCAAYDAIINYALYGTEPELEKLGDSAAIAFDLMRPHLDSSRRKAEAGRRGGLGEDGGSGAQAFGKLGAGKRENKNKNKNEYEYKRESQSTPKVPPIDFEALKKVMVYDDTPDYLR